MSRFLLRTRYLCLILILGLGLTAVFIPLSAQENNQGQIQIVTGWAGTNAGAFYALPNLKEGQTLYLFGEGTSGDLDPLLLLADTEMDRKTIREEFQTAVAQAVAAGGDPLQVIPQFADQVFTAWDDDSGPGYTAVIEYLIPADGDYIVALISTAAQATSGNFQLTIGLDAPEVLSGSAQATGDIIAHPDTQNSLEHEGIQEITGALTSEDPVTYFDLYPVAAGDILYVYVEATSGDLKPILNLSDFGDKPLANGNFSGQATEATLQYTFDSAMPAPRLTITACCADSNQTSGDFRLLVGLNSPDVLNGHAASTGHSVFRLPQPVKVGVKLQQITGVDQKAENFGAVASLRLEWTDPALAFSPDSCDCRFKVFRGESFNQFATNNEINWPEFTLFNQQGNRWVQNRYVVVYPEGRAIYFERFSTTFQAPDFNFERFPFDTQDFYIRVDSIYPDEIFAFVDDLGFTEVGDQLGEEEWYITNSDTFVTSEIESTKSTTSRYSFFFEARRHLSFYIFRIFVPLAIIIIISWFTFFLNDYGKRVDVAGSNMLLFIAYNFTIANDLPRLGYLTLMDRFLVSTFVVTGLVLVFNVYLKRVEMTNKDSFILKLDQYMLWIYPLAYVAAFIMVTFFFT